MKYRIDYISTFHKDALSTDEFLDEYPSKAMRIFAKIENAILNLIEMPEMYPVYQYAPAYRLIVVEDYVVLYKVSKQDGIVEVHRLFYGGMDIPAHLQGWKNSYAIDSNSQEISNL